MVGFSRIWHLGRRPLHTFLVPIVIALFLYLSLEFASSLALRYVVHPTRLERFDNIFAMNWDEYQLKPHPFLRYVQPQYVQEKERYLQHISERRTNTVYIVALGGSTTKRGYPKYTERFLNERLRELNASLEVVVFNFGVDGWSSFQSTQNYFYLLKYLHPDFILVHHNHNEGWVENFFNENAVESYPYITPLERNLVAGSSFYKLLKYTYLLVYNRIRFGADVRSFELVEADREYTMTSRISAYINDKDPEAFLPRFFEWNFVAEESPEFPREFLLAENYGSLIQYARADGAEVALITMYQNFSKAAEGKYANDAASKKAESDGINRIVRDISEQYGITLVALAREMKQYDSLLIDEVHFSEAGIRVKGELIGEGIWDRLAWRYNLSRPSHSSGNR